MNARKGSSSSASPQDPLLTTKLSIPPARLNLVPRPQLIERLNEGLRPGCKLTLVSAPAGFGKTTLLAEWLPHHAEEQRGRGAGETFPLAPPLPCPPARVAWLSLDENDNDPARFFAYLVAALQKIDPNIGQAAQAMLQAPQPPPSEALLTSLINDIAATHHLFILVFDDYHLIRAMPIHQQLAFLLEHQPPQMHLVIATREDPLLPLSRWRARGQMVEIRQADLRFTEEETADLLRRVMRLKLATPDVAALHRRTEGWVAGLQLAALSMQGRDDARQFVESFTGSHRYVLDYLIEEVFQRQPADVQVFLLKTSILDRFTASLCDAVLSRGAEEQGSKGESSIPPAPQLPSHPAPSQQTLAYLESANLFIVPLDASRQWYRYHHLFADLLRHRLQTVEARDVAPLHKRASAWYEANGFPADAVHHALAGSDWERAATLILGVSGTMLSHGEVTTLLNWLKALPDDLVRAHPQLCLTCSWALILTGQLDAAESYLGQAEAISQDVTALLGEIIAAQAYVARARGDDDRTIELSQRALSLLPPTDLSARSVVAVNLGIAHWNSGHLTEAEQALTEAYQAAQQSGNDYARLMALGFLGVIQATWGKLNRAAELFRQAIRSGGMSPAAALAHNELGALLYEWNDLEAAADHLRRGIELGQRTGNVEIQIGGYRTLARLKQAQGVASAALDVLEKAHQLARDHALPPNMRARDAACHVQIALAQNDTATAIRWAEQISQDADASPFYPLLGLTQARFLIAQNRKASATKLLEACSETAARAGWRYGLIAVRVLQSLAAPTHAQAFVFLAEALAMAQPEGFIRIFADAGEPLMPLLQEATLRGVMPEYVGKIMAAIKGRPRPMTPGPSPLVEPLSEREIEVLRLVAAGLSNREIAKKLVISPGTAKTHIHNVCSKLGVRNRTEAAMHAKELGLV